MQVDDAYLGDESAGGKRGRGSENKTPMLVAVQVTDAGQPVRVKLSVVDVVPKNVVEQWAGQNLIRV